MISEWKTSFFVEWAATSAAWAVRGLHAAAHPWARTSQPRLATASTLHKPPNQPPTNLQPTSNRPSPSLPQAAVTVRHLMLPCAFPQRAGLLKDLITSYGCGGRTIIFTDSKKEAAELSVTLGDSLGAQVGLLACGCWPVRDWACGMWCLESVG
jgi:hypothetical protein